VLERWIFHFARGAHDDPPLARIDDPGVALARRPRRRGDALLIALYPRRDARRTSGASDWSGCSARLRRSARDARRPRRQTPVYLGLAFDAAQTMKLKPQNLLVNLPRSPESV
jgi:hypothetical protein